MTDMNPLALLQEMMTKPPEPDEGMKQLIQLKTANEKKALETEDAASNLLRGLFTDLNNPAQAAPTREDFNRKYRENVSPARELLADMFRGMSASFTGAKFQTDREMRWQEEQQQQVMKIQQQKADQMYKAQIVKQLQDEVQSRRQTAMQTDMQLMKQELAQTTKREDQKRTIAQFMVKYGLDAGKLQELQRHNTEMEKGKAAATAMPKDPYMQAGLLNARSQMMSAGQNPNVPESQAELWDMATKFANDLYDTRQQLDEKYKRPVERRQPYTRIQVTNPFGEIETGTKNSETGEWLNKPEWWIGDPQNFGQEQLNKMQTQRAAVDAMRLSTDVFMRNPGDVTGITKALPASLRQIWDGLPAGERTYRVFFNSALSQYILGMSGVATSGREEERLKEGLGKFWEKPQNFAMGALAFQSMLEAQAMRREAGIDPGKLDFGGKLSDILEYAKTKLAKGEYNFRIPRAQELIEEAAKEQGVKLVYDSRGRLRGMK